MKLTRTVHFNPVLVGIIPLVNVVFLLLAFFSLNSTFVLQPGVSVNLPISSFSLRPAHPQIVSITADPTPAIYFEDAKLTFEEFAERLAKTSDNNERTLVIRADKGIPYETVVRVMNEGLLRGYPVVLATADKPTAFK